jgi:competence protein ComEC
VDVRLAVGTAVAWLALEACAGRSALAVLLAGSAAVAVGVAAVLRAGRRAGGPAAAVGLVGFCVAMLLLPYAGRLAVVRASPLTALAASGSAVTLELVVTADPKMLAATGVAGVPRVAVATSAVLVSAAGRRWTSGGDVLVLAPAAPWREVLPGQRVQVDGTLAPSLDPGSLSVTLFARAPPVLIGRPPWFQRMAGRVRAGLRSAAASLPPAERGLLPGLVDGDTAGLDPVLVERFRVAGLTHLVAVSGTNCSILVGAVLLVLRRAGVRPWLAAAVGAVVLIGFVLVARPSPSVLRAAVMAAIALVALASGRPRQAIPALSAATLGLLIWDPTLGADPGFAMSVLATAALLGIAPGWADALRRRRVPAGVAEAVAVAAAAHLVTAPVIAAISGRVSLVAIPANVLAEPVVAPATIFGFLAAGVSPFWLPGARICAWVAGWPCRWLVGVADRLGGLPGAAISWPGGTSGGLSLLAAALALVLLARRAGLARLLVGLVMVVALIQIPLRVVIDGWPPPGWDFVACDVGQGDGLVLNAGGGAAVEVDAGPDPLAIDRCLRALHVDTIALLIFTHYHLDHVGGIVGALHDRTVQRVVAGPLPEPLGGVELVRAALAGRKLTVGSLSVGSSLQVGAVRLDVLGPAEPFHGTRSDPNNSSLVLRATVGGVRILLCGDAEIEAQQAMVAARVDLRADVLKVPHHGSAYFDPTFLAAVHARVGVISVGLHNDYGHPSPLLLRELAVLGVPVRRTDHDGDVAVSGSARTLSTISRQPSSVAAGAPGPPPRGGSGGAVGGAIGGAVGSASVGPVRSVADVRMGTCRPPAEPVPSASTSCPTRCLRSWCCSATRSCWSAGPSARSPPCCAGPSPRPRSPSAPAARSRVRSCTSCSARRCSASRGWW